MTAPAMFRRNAADVQAMRLESLSAFPAGQGWLRDHGVRSFLWIGAGEATLTIYGPGSRMVARLGDWLTLDVGSGAFTVVTDEDFRKDHRERVETGER